MTQPPLGPPPGQPPEGGRLSRGPGSGPAARAYVPRDSSYPPPGAGYPVDPQRPPSYASDPQPVRPREPRRSSPIIAPVLAFIALLLVGGASFFFVNYLSATIDTAAAEAEESSAPAVAAAAVPTEGPAATAAVEPTDPPASEATDEPDPLEETLPPEPDTTAEPITVVPPSDEQQDVVGSILFTRLGGDIWVASGKTWQSLTDSSSDKADSTPTWSPDGKHIYFIRSTKKEVKDGQARLKGKYTLYPTDLLRMKADGSDKKLVLRSLINDGRGLWFRHVLQPSVSPAGNNVAVVSDGSDGSADGVELHVVNSKSGRLRKVNAPTEVQATIRLGHNDPDFDPKGTRIAFTYNQSAGTEGDPRIGIFTCQSRSNCSVGKTKLLKSGYANPSWSPDGKLLAVEATSGDGRDIAVISAKGGHERVRLTTGGASFAPEFSPNGDQIAYLRRDGLGIDIRVMTLDIDGRGKITLVDDRPVTSDGAVDGESGLSWYIPKSERARSADPADEADADASENPDDALEGAPPPPPGS